MEAKKYNIGQLSELSGISRRTIRYYVQTKLLLPPKGAGRGHYYTHEHLEILRHIIALKENNLSLDEVAVTISQATDKQNETTLPTTWTRLKIMQGVEINIEGGKYPLTPGRIKKLHKFLLQLFGAQNTDSAKKETNEDAK